MHYLRTLVNFIYNHWLLYFIVMILYCVLRCIICPLFDIQIQNISVRYHFPISAYIFFGTCQANLINGYLRFRANTSEHVQKLSQNVEIYLHFNNTLIRHSEIVAGLVHINFCVLRCYITPPPDFPFLGYQMQCLIFEIVLIIG